MEANSIRTVLSSSDGGFHRPSDEELDFPFRYSISSRVEDDAGLPRSRSDRYYAHLLAMILLWALVLLLSSLALPGTIHADDSVASVPASSSQNVVPATASRTVPQPSARKHRDPVPAMDYRAFLFMMKGMESELARESRKREQNSQGVAVRNIDVRSIGDRH